MIETEKIYICVGETIYFFETNGIMTKQFQLLSFNYDGILQYENDSKTECEKEDTDSGELIGFKNI